jgi:hypothetical protein
MTGGVTLAAIAAMLRRASPPPKLGGVGSGGEVNPKSAETSGTLRGALVA